MRKTAREAAALCGVTELIGQMSWHLKQVAKHFVLTGCIKKMRCSGARLRETVKLINLETFVAESLFCLQLDVALQDAILHEK